MSDEDLGKVFDWGLMSRLLAYIRPYKRRAQIGIVAMLVLQAVHRGAAVSYPASRLTRLTRATRTACGSLSGCS